MMASFYYHMGFPMLACLHLIENCNYLIVIDDLIIATHDPQHGRVRRCNFVRHVLHHFGHLQVLFDGCSIFNVPVQVVEFPWGEVTYTMDQFIWVLFHMSQMHHNFLKCADFLLELKKWVYHDSTFE